MNVVWIIADTLMKDASGSYGNKSIRTPSLDNLAANSMHLMKDTNVPPQKWSLVWN
jgi:arylsulfatase A-like enzyme